MQDQNTQGMSRGMQTIWICLAIFLMGFTAIGMSLRDEENCEGFMGKVDEECARDKLFAEVDRTTARLLGSYPR